MISMKYVWKITLRRALKSGDRQQGYALAGSMGEALELAGAPDAIAVPQPGKAWQGPEGANFFWHDWQPATA
ncbi:hypothetical protein [uncultured Roseobacter sp.]|uniref:hypothetical protein n=1 Tax=uncultured Roseobacter sp. TaxID=114847 RepID=UPI0026261C2D|nr:hypothetical protein [uncultured Roseobacter sp.]